MKTYRIEIFTKSEFNDVHSNEVLADIRQLGITAVEGVQAVKVFLLSGDFDADTDANGDSSGNSGPVGNGSENGNRSVREILERIAGELLADPVCEGYYIGNSGVPAGLAEAHIIEVHLKPGVTDPVAGSTTMALNDMQIAVKTVRTARKYIILGAVSYKQRQLIAQKVLANDCIEQVIFDNESDVPDPHLQPYKLNLKHINICELSGQELVELSRKYDLFLNKAEMLTIQEHYRKLKREPTDIELEMIAQTWSEHCVHKTFRGVIEYKVLNNCNANNTENDIVRDEVAGSKGSCVIRNLLKTTIAAATHELAKPWCVSVFEDNAGIVKFDDDYGVCFKVETHNHPSAIEPYGGAATGIGGCIRDPMGTGLSAWPIANTDIFCFAPPDMKQQELPEGVLHPRRVMKGVVGGVRDYGNRMGIPTINGAVLFDQRYLGNPLVFCGNIGLIPLDKCFGKPQAGDLIVVLGGRTGRDGIHGATFSSGEMTHEHESLFAHAVQIGNPIVEKKVLDVLMQARDEELYDAITDCGAGGLSSAVGEMAQDLGAVVDLENIPLKYEGLSYTEIWISEAQERMVISVPVGNIERVREIFAAEDVEATVIGKFGNDGKLELRYDGVVVGELDMEFLHNGLPVYTRKAVWQKPALQEPEANEILTWAGNNSTIYGDNANAWDNKNSGERKSTVSGGGIDYTGALKSILSDYNVASKEWIIRQYDHEVQGGSAVKPLVGVELDGPGDASVIRPVLSKDMGLATGCGICPSYSDIDPYWMALAAIDEAVRNVVSVGGRADRIALLDNFCWGNCDKPDRLGGLVRAGKACYDGAMAYEAPFISGKDSLNNEFRTGTGETISIPGTLLISAFTIVDDVHNCVTMDAKQAGSMLLIVGETRNELGGGQFYKLLGKLGANVPRVDLKAGPANARAVAAAIEQGLVLSCHDCSEGGLAVALAEMAFAGGFGIEADLSGIVCSSDVVRAEQLLFSETPSRYIVEIRREDFGAFASLCGQVRFAEIGKVVSEPRLVIRDAKRNKVVDADIFELKQCWQGGLGV